MDQHYYYQALRKTLLGFLDIFNGIQVGKYNKKGNLIKTVDVPIKFAPKQKFYYFIHDHRHEKRFPMMSAEITGISYDSNRKTGKHEKTYIQELDDSIEYQITPAPYNIEFELKAATEYMVEMEQIASQILPYFDPYVMVRIYIDELMEYRDIPVILNDISIEQDSDIGEDERRLILWTFSFTVKSWISKPKGDISFIKKVIQKIYTTEEAWENHTTETENVSGGKYDSVEYFTKGTKEDDKILIDYEVFE